MRRLFVFLIWTIALLAILLINCDVSFKLSQYAENTFQLKPVIIYTTLFPIFFGMLMCLPKFLGRIRKSKKCKVDWVKLCIVGIPSCYLGLNPILMVMGIPSILPVTFMQYGTLSTISEIVLGYVILDSLTWDKTNSI